MKHYYFIFTLLLVLMSLMIFGQANPPEKIDNKKEWVYVGLSKQLDQLYIRSTCETKKGQVIRIWTLALLKSQQWSDSIYSNATLKQLLEFDCTNKKVKQLSAAMYTSDGRLLEWKTIEDNKQKWDYVVPDSMAEKMLLAVCGKFK